MLDRQDVRVVGRLGDEPLDGRGEALIRVVDEEVADPDRREDVGRLVLVGRQEAGRRDGRPRRVLRSGRSRSARSRRPVRSSIPGPRTRRPRRARARGAGASRVASGIDRSTSSRTASPKRRRRSSSSIARRRSSASSSSSARSALRVTRKRWCSKISMPLNRRSRLAPMIWSSRTNRFGSTWYSRGRIWGTLTRAKWRSSGLGVAQPDRDRQAQRRDVRERVARIHRERRQDRIDLVDEALAEQVVVLRDRAVLDDLDALGGERLAGRRSTRRLLRHELEDALAGRRELLAGGPAVGRRRRSSPRGAAGAARRSGSGRTRRACSRRSSGS